MNTSTVLVALIGFPGLVLAQVCTDIEDDNERLACYDAIIETPSSIPEAPAALAEQQAAPAEQQAAPAETPLREPGNNAETTMPAAAPGDFGKTEPFDTAREYIEASIVEITTSANIDYLRLDNGQVWRETEESRLRFKIGRKVTITEGIMGSFDLRMEGNKNVVKVRRIR